MSHDTPAPVGGRIVSPFLSGLLGLMALAGLLLLWRFAAGLGAVTALNDGYPWGLWIAFDVVVGTALACGGYAVAILVYILNRGEYHPLVRPAVLTSALGYTLAGAAIVIDVGRYWNLFLIPVRPWTWNLHSPLLEVALCVMAYIVVLWIELSPALFEKWRASGDEARAQKGERWLGVWGKIAAFVIALGLLLPTMHQSSLGTVMMLAGHKLHPLWNTPMLPLLFLVSCIGMGYGVVIFESAVSGAVFGRPRHTAMLAKLSGAMVVVLGLYLVLRFADVVIRGKLGLLFRDGYSLLFWLEIALFAAPMVMLMDAGRRRNFPTLFRAATLMLLAGAVYRFDTYLVAFRPGAQWAYFPSLWEILITAGVVAVEIAAYIVIVKRFPVLAGGRSAESA